MEIRKLFVTLTILRNISIHIIIITFFCTNSVYGNSNQTDKTAYEPTSPEDMTSIGDELYMKRNFIGAIEKYKQAIKLSPEKPELYQKLGDASVAVGDDETAITAYSKALSISPKDGTTHYSLGVALERNGELDDAIAEYNISLKYSSTNFDAHRRLADIYALKGNVKKSISEYKLLLERNPENTVVNYKLARLFTRVRKYNDAISLYKKAIEQDENNVSIRNELASLLLSLKKYKSSEGYFRSSLKIQRSDLKARRGYIVTLAKQMKMDELLAFMDEEASLFPTDPNTFFKQGIVLEYQKQYLRAIEAFNKSNSLLPRPKTLGSIAKIYLKLGQKDKARSVLVKAKKLDPNFEPVQDMLFMLDDSSHKKVPSKKTKKKARKKARKKK